MQHTTSQSLLDLVTFGGIGHVTATTIEFDNITALDGYNIDNFTINPDGTITVHGGTEPGEYVFTYTLCPTGSTTGCADVTCTITINTTVRANQDIFYYGTSGTYYGSAETINTPNIGVAKIITNDGYAADCGLNAPNSFTPAVLFGNVTNLTINQTALAVGNFQILSNGKVSLIDPSLHTGPGDYPFSYTICDLFNPSVCSTTNGWISVIFDGISKMVDNHTINNLDNNVNFDLNNTIITPNPSEGIFRINFEGEIFNGTIEIYSILGQKLYNQSISNISNLNLDLNGYAIGTYTLRISNSDQTITKLIIKK